MSDVKTKVTDISNLLEKIELPESVKSEEVDWEQVNWYKERFELFQRDGCRKANIAYTEHARANDKLNRATRLQVLLLATRM